MLAARAGFTRIFRRGITIRQETFPLYTTPSSGIIVNEPKEGRDSRARGTGHSLCHPRTTSKHPVHASGHGDDRLFPPGSGRPRVHPAVLFPLYTCITAPISATASKNFWCEHFRCISRRRFEDTRHEELVPVPYGYISVTDMW